MSELKVPHGFDKHTTNCVNYGHNWLYHHSYDDSIERYVSHRGCEHWSGCKCVGWKEPEKGKLEMRFMTIEAARIMLRGLSAMQIIELVVTGLDIWLAPHRPTREEFVEKVLIPELRKLYQ